jgi:hypothetical protein
VIIGEGEMVAGVQPAVVGMAEALEFADVDHGRDLGKFMGASSVSDVTVNGIVMPKVAKVGSARACARMRERVVGCVGFRRPPPAYRHVLHFGLYNPMHLNAGARGEDGQSTPPIAPKRKRLRRSCVREVEHRRPGPRDSNWSGLRVIGELKSQQPRCRTANSERDEWAENGHSSTVNHFVGVAKQSSTDQRH